jgi:hypothetical protein
MVGCVHCTLILLHLMPVAGGTLGGLSLSSRQKARNKHNVHAIRGDDDHWVHVIIPSLGRQRYGKTDMLDIKLDRPDSFVIEQAIHPHQR